MQAADYKQTMINRVNYLAKEEQKFLKKIQKTRLEADKRALIKDEKIITLYEFQPSKMIVSTRSGKLILLDNFDLKYRLWRSLERKGPYNLVKHN